MQPPSFVDSSDIKTREELPHVSLVHSFDTGSLLVSQPLLDITHSVLPFGLIFPVFMGIFAEIRVVTQVWVRSFDCGIDLFCEMLLSSRNTGHLCV